MVETKQPRRVQVVDISAIKPAATNFMCHSLTCGVCGKQTRAQTPREARGGVFGPLLNSLVALFFGRYRLSKRLPQEFLRDVLGVNLALGSVCNIERRVHEALAKPVADANNFVQKQGVVHADETGSMPDRGKAWLWVAVCPLVAVFVIATSRGKDVAQSLLGKTFSGIAVTDRWAAYAWLSVEQRQICWSHLLRVQSWVDDGGPGVAIGKRCYLTHEPCPSGGTSSATDFKIRWSTYKTT